jgi:hypothetical protein
LDNAALMAAIPESASAFGRQQRRFCRQMSRQDAVQLRSAFRPCKHSFARLQAARATERDFTNPFAAVKAAFILHFLCQLS